MSIWRGIDCELRYCSRFHSDSDDHDSAERTTRSLSRARTVYRSRRALSRVAAIAFVLCLPLMAQAVTTTWSAAGSLATARTQHSATLLVSGRVLVAGGIGGGDAVNAEQYNPVTNTWSAAGSLATIRNFTAATLLPSGKVLVEGGQDVGNVFASADLYDPASNTWSATGSLATARYSHTATLLPSGQVLVVGGTDGSNYFANTELYDPASNSWSAGVTLTSAHSRHTSTVLATGQVLVAGGNNGGPLGNAELYTLNLLFADNRRPIIASATSPIVAGQSLSVTGSGFNGDSEASGGSSNNSATNYPLVQLRRIDSNQIAWTSPISGAIRSDTSYTATLPLALPTGPYAATVIVNGIPSVAKIIQVTSDRIFASGFN